MLKFRDYKYERPDFDSIENDLKILLKDFNDSLSLKEENNIFIKINQLRRYVNTMKTVCFIRHSIDTNNEFYEEEQKFIDDNLPRCKELEGIFYRLLLRTDYREDLERVWGRQIFRIAEMTLDTFSEEISEEIIEEKKLVSAYSKLMASAEIVFAGEKRTLSQLMAFMENPSRDIRKAANEAYNGFFMEHEEELDEIYDRLVKVRTQMARKLGFENFIELGYHRLCRTDYGPEDVGAFRDQVYRELVKASQELKEEQRIRLGLDKLYYYDEALIFKKGNPMPKGDARFILAKGKQMYGEMSTNTSDFFNNMLKWELMDLASKEGKMGGGYCDYIYKLRSPFIFANFNGTRADIDVLTHEVGHAFQAYMSRDMELKEYIFPTNEASEIHSMTMEFITYPWMDLFFGEDAKKYRYAHLTSAVSFIPYAVLVDEFQHEVYRKPHMSKVERRLKWRELEKKYLPYRDYGDSDFLESGGYWFRQAHIFEDPFYYIDYGLAQICAFQFFNKLKKDRQAAWRDYMKICEIGGSRSFLEILELGNLENPFKEGTIAKTIEPIKNIVDAIDASKY